MVEAVEANEGWAMTLGVHPVGSDQCVGSTYRDGRWRTGVCSAAGPGDYVEVMIDSGSEAHACPEHVAHHVPLRQPSGEKILRDVQGAEIPQMGTRAVPCKLTEWGDGPHQV